jgi:hypothetical protein
MGKFSTQSEATMTARASMIALLTVPHAPADKAKAEKSGDAPSLSRRRFLALR